VSNDWIGVDLDRTLAEYDTWKGEGHVGAPIPAMVERVRTWIAEGRQVRILTARVASTHGIASVTKARETIQAWCEEHLGVRLLVTAEKDHGLIELWDDRAVAVEPKTGVRLSPSAVES
jgi:hypothetical protein